MTEQVRDIAIKDLVFSESNPRRDVGDISELAASIREHGVLEPILVMPVAGNGHFAVVAGRRRWAASVMAGKPTVPAIVRQMTDADAEAVALVENLQRADLSPLEEAQGYARWLEIKGKAGEKVTHDDLAKAVGKARSSVTNTLRLLHAPKPVRDAVAKGTVSAAGARILLTVPDELLGLMTIKAGVTVGELEEEAAQLQRVAPTIAKIREEFAEAQAKGQITTWPRTLYVRSTGATLQLVKLFGDPPKPIVGELHSDLVARHDKACSCRAVGVVTENYGERVAVRRVCVDRAGWNKFETAQRSEVRSRGRTADKGKKQSAAEIARARAKRMKERDQARAKRVREAQVAASGALKGGSGYGRIDLKADAKLTKGGIDKEPARLILFSLVTRMSHAWAPGWRAELWKLIAKMPLKQVRDAAVLWGAAGTLHEVGSRADERTELTRVVFEHFGIAVPEPKKAKKARR